MASTQEPQNDSIKLNSSMLVAVVSGSCSDRENGDERNKDIMMKSAIAA
jgi:hypothetical protein